MGKNKKKKNNDYVDIDPRINDILDGILHYVECMEQYLIPVGESKEEMKKAAKKIRKKIDQYRKGEIELFIPEFYEAIENGPYNEEGFTDVNTRW